jgi:hypothetical protein
VSSATSAYGRFFEFFLFLLSDYWGWSIVADTFWFGRIQDQHCEERRAGADCCCGYGGAVGGCRGIG